VKRVAVLLFNLGGPKAPADVKPFLYNLFRDKYIIDLPFGLRQGVAAMIANSRAPSARKNYAYMGGGSPIVPQTIDQAQALEKLLGKVSGLEAKVFVGMRYWHPFIEDITREIAAWGPDEIVVLPLYPQFSSTTTLSGFEAFRKAYKGKAPVKYVCCYADNDHFIAAQVKIIRNWLQFLPQDEGKRRILFSAHGLPEKIIQKGDPYQAQVEACVARIVAELDGPCDYQICYQSRVGPLKWIGPSTEEAIREAGKDEKAVMVVPIAFVSEHIETRVELDIEYGSLAAESGVKIYTRAPTVNLEPNFIKALNDEVLKALGANGITGDHNCDKCHSFCPKRPEKRNAA